MSTPSLKAPVTQILDGLPGCHPRLQTESLGLLRKLRGARGGSGLAVER